jgi:hypothetical protein
MPPMFRHTGTGHRFINPLIYPLINPLIWPTLNAQNAQNHFPPG